MMKRFLSLLLALALVLGLFPALLVSEAASTKPTVIVNGVTMGLNQYLPSGSQRALQTGITGSISCTVGPVYDGENAASSPLHWSGGSDSFPPLSEGNYKYIKIGNPTISSPTKPTAAPSRENTPPPTPPVRL